MSAPARPTPAMPAPRFPHIRNQHHLGARGEAEAAPWSTGLRRRGHCSGGMPGVAPGNFRGSGFPQRLRRRRQSSSKNSVQGHIVRRSFFIFDEDGNNTGFPPGDDVQNSSGAGLGNDQVPCAAGWRETVTRMVPAVRVLPRWSSRTLDPIPRRSGRSPSRRTPDQSFARLAARRKATRMMTRSESTSVPSMSKMTARKVRCVKAAGIGTVVALRRRLTIFFRSRVCLSTYCVAWHSRGPSRRRQLAWLP